jgi:YVTN family beta-propeller protein
LHAGEVVSAERLIDDLWGERPPPGAPKALQAHISRLRKALEVNGAASPEGDGDASGSAAGLLATRGRGYVLRVQPGELDLDRFQALVETGRQALAMDDPRQAAGTLRAALALWRGPALADFAYEGFAQAPIAQLEEQRLSAVEDRVEADLVLGHEESLVGELTALVRQNRLRERMRMQLMLALYRCGRQAEALDVFQEYRRGLAEELGLDPSPRLQQLEGAILARDPSLDVHPNPAAPAAATADISRLSRGGRKRHRLALGGLVLIALAMTMALLVWLGGGGARRSVIAADSVGTISPSGGALGPVVPLDSSPSSVAAGAGALWVANYSDDTVSEINPATHTVEEKLTGVSTPSGIAVGGGGVWVANNFSGTVSWINPAVDRVVKPIPVGNGPSGVAVGYGSVWVTNSSDGTLSRINAVSGVPSRPIALGGGATDVAVGADAVWVSDEADDRVLRIDPNTDQPTDRINVGNGPTAITVGFGSVWVTNSLDGTVTRINPQTDDVVGTIQVGKGPNAIAAGAGAVWIANEFDGSVSGIDPASDVAHMIKVGSRPQGLAVARGMVWVGAGAAGASHRGGTLTVLSSVPLLTLDPAQAYQPGGTSLTNDGLTAFKRVGGSDGAQVVPDLATSLPAPTDGGTTYTFQLRPGIRYSNGAPVRPEDFRRAIERDFKLGDAIAPTYYRDLIGGEACASSPVRCNLSRGIVADDAAGTVTFHLVAPDPELLYRLAVWDAVAVPAGTPDHDVGRHPIPATGAYEVASASLREVKYVRNPYFHVWSRAARPDGYPDQILLKEGASPSAELTAVEQGRADYTLDGPPTNRLSEVQTRFAIQLHPTPDDVLDQLVLNTRVPPFNDIRVRRALNYAVDRGKVGELVGSDAQPTCQFLPPYISGYERYCPYTLDPGATGVWRAPDLATAERLIAASGTRGTRIAVWMLGIFGDPTGIGRYVVSLLDRLGYRAQFRDLTSDPTSVGRFANSRTKVQVAISGYFPNYPRPSEFIQWFLSCQNFVPNSPYSANWSELCDPRLDGEIRRALAADGTNSPTAPSLWAAADRIATADAPPVPLVNPSTFDLVSRRLGNYQHNPQLGILIDQAWVQ